MTKSEKVRLVVGATLLLTGLIWPVPADDKEFGQSIMAMIIVPMMLWVSALYFLAPVVVSRRREIWRWIRDFCRG